MDAAISDLLATGGAFAESATPEACPTAKFWAPKGKLGFSTTEFSPPGSGAEGNPNRPLFRAGICFDPPTVAY